VRVHSYNGNYVSDPSAAVLIYNPVAGRLRKRPHVIERLTAILTAQAGAVEPLPTPGPRTAGELARQAVERGASRVYVAGGDGTINEAVAGMAGSTTPMAVLPLGTANVFCMETGLGSNALRVAQRINELVPRDVALGQLELAGQAARPFLLMAGVGLDARIVRLVSPEVKRRLGKLSYWQGGFAQLGKPLEEFDISFNGRVVRASFALIARVANYGGDLAIARHADLRTDDFAVVLFEGRSSVRYLKYFSGVLLNRLENMKGITVGRATELEVTPCAGQRVDVQVDGELAGDAPAKISIAPRRLRLLLPRGYVDAPLKG